MARIKREGSHLEESPLRTTLHSTINANKFDPTRFTEIRDSENEANPVRIIIYVIIVIVVGVGAALLVRNLITNQTPQTESNDETDTTTPPPASLAFETNLTPLPDESATSLGANSEYGSESITTLGEQSVDGSTLSLDKIVYSRYTTFGRLEFMLTGGDSELPVTTINFDEIARELTVSFKDLTDINEELLNEKIIDDIVTSVSYSEEDKVFVIKLSEESKYRVLNSDGNLIIDIKTVEELEKPEEPETPVATPPTTTPTTPPTTPPAADGNKPAAPHYTNEFSQSKQYISSSITTNTLTVNNFWVWDEGSFFELSFGETNKAGDSAIPNASAYLETEDGKNYIYVEIENLSQTLWQNTSSKKKTAAELTANSGVNPAGANIVSAELVSFTNGKATYRIELKNKANFKLVNQQTYDKNSQITSIQIKD